jgi:serine/threonine protein kinase
MDASNDKLIGSFAGNFQIRSLIGEGGMARVYSAQHPTLGKLAAIKVLSHGLSDDQELVQRFVTEAQAVARLNHPNIVEIADFGRLPDGRPFYVMEQLNGENLQAYLQRVRQVSVANLISILEPVLGALESAHAAGIIHRDLKPDNIFLALRGDTYVPKLLDFGIAKLMQPDVTSKTAAGSLLGTPAYMSPEQASGQIDQISARSDIYSVGVVAYEMLAGRPPFVAAHLGELILQHLTVDAAPLAGIRPDVPVALTSHIHACLAKDPAHRPASVALLRTMLRSIGTGGPISAHIMSVPPPGQFAQGTPVFQRERDFDPNGQTVDVSRPMPMMKPSAVGNAQPTPPQQYYPSATPSQHAGYQQAPNVAPSTAQAFGQATLTLQAQQALAANGQARQIAPSTARTRDRKQTTLWSVVIGVCLVAITATFFAVKALQKKSPPAAPAIALAPPANAPVVPTITPIEPAPVAVIAAAPSTASLPSTKSTTKKANPANPAITSIDPRAPAPVNPTVITGGNVVVNGKPVAPSTTTPPTHVTPLANGGDDESPEYQALVRELTDAQYARDYTRGLAAAEKALGLQPSDVTVRFQAVMMACQANREDAAKRHFAFVRNAQQRAGLEQACIALGSVYLTPESHNSSAAKSKEANDLYMQAAELINKDDAKAAKLFERSYDINPDKTDYQAAWRAGEAACRSNNPSLVKKIWGRLPDRIKPDVIEACQDKGVVIPGYVEPKPL